LTSNAILSEIRPFLDQTLVVPVGSIEHQGRRQAAAQRETTELRRMRTTRFFISIFCSFARLPLAGAGASEIAFNTFLAG